MLVHELHGSESLKNSKANNENVFKIHCMCLKPGIKQIAGQNLSVQLQTNYVFAIPYKKISFHSQQNVENN